MEKKKTIFGFNSNFEISEFLNFKKFNNNNNKNKNFNNTQKSSFEIYNNRNNYNSNLIPKSNHFIALNKTNSFKYFSNFNHENTEIIPIKEEKKELLKNSDLKYSERNKNFYKNELLFTHSNFFSPTSFHNNIDSCNFTNTATNNFYSENPTNFETDLKRKTTEFSKTSKMRFYEAKTNSFKNLAEFNRKKLKKILIDESKNIELIEKIEKSKEHKPK
jgi:hypothetical protein